MSSFYCEKCGALCSDTEHGYISGCGTYPADIGTPSHCPGCERGLLLSNGIHYNPDGTPYKCCYKPQTGPASKTKPKLILKPTKKQP